MSGSRRRIDVIMEAGFLTDVAGLEIAEVRRRRTMCRDVESELSYYRRLLHGRLDLLAYERRRRAGEATQPILEALPEILHDAPTGSSRRASVGTASTEPPVFAGRGRRRLDFVLGEDFLGRLPDLEDEELDRIEMDLVEMETTVSAQRGEAQRAHDALSDEIGRRYRLGLTSVDELFTD